MEPFNLQNIIDGQGIDLSITGMVIVFIGLTLISLFIYCLPLVLGALEKKPKEPQLKEGDKKETTSPNTKGEPDKEAINAVIGLVIHMELEIMAAADNQKITISQTEDQRSLWGSAGKMRSLR